MTEPLHQNGRDGENGRGGHADARDQNGDRLTQGGAGDFERADTRRKEHGRAATTQGGKGTTHETGDERNGQRAAGKPGNRPTHVGETLDG